MVVNEEKEPMDLKKIGEFGFINKISRSCVIRPDNIIRAIGDDAAAFTVAADEVSLITTDLLVERIHFIRKTITGFDLGYKALAVNLSDIAAMGGEAREAFVSIGIPQTCPLDYLEAVYDGIKHLAAKFDVNILGGDTTGSEIDLIINVVVHGTAAKNKLLRRDAAKPGDIIFSTGHLGNSNAGLHLILNNLPVDSAEMRALYRAHVLPEPHLREGSFLADQSGIRAAIDISDGLSSDLGHIAEQSGVGATIYASEIPVSDALQKFCGIYGFDPLEYALGGGEDYTLLCTAAPEKAKEIAQKFQNEFNRPLFSIGKVTADSRLETIYPDDTSKPISARGWDHFKLE
jgi:thiamine-monophosphate kinase